ncbi:hypothetical protein EDB83DRAFT_2241235, partial [Lactarius deliciosus]
YLPPYSSDPNPIEEVFIEAWLHANSDYVLGEIEGVSADPYKGGQSTGTCHYYAR